MGNERTHRRILDWSRSSYIQFALRRHFNVNGAVGLIPLRERTALTKGFLLTPRDTDAATFHVERL
jgi:hypothetical protein